MAYVTGTSHPDTVALSGVKKTQLINEVKCASLLQKKKIKKERELKKYKRRLGMLRVCMGKERSRREVLAPTTPAFNVM
jgi:hypothetical protein